MPLLVDPVPPQVAAALRRLVLGLRTGEPRRVFAPVVHVGGPGLEVAHGVRGDEDLDHALRADVVGALLRRSRACPGPRDDAPLLWITRPGELNLHDVDAAWLSAARSAYAEAGLPLTMVVVTRQGWWDPRSGTRRIWKRLRQR